MNEDRKTAVLLIDAGCESPGIPPGAGAGRRPVPLVPNGGEYARAIARLRASTPSAASFRRIPDEVFLHLYAGEIVERIRERVTAAGEGEGALLVLPFWPRALFEAAGLITHAVREIERLLPPILDTACVRRGDTVIAAELLRVLGEIRVEPRDYRRAIERRARAAHWRILDPGD